MLPSGARGDIGQLTDVITTVRRTGKSDHSERFRGSTSSAVISRGECGRDERLPRGTPARRRCCTRSRPGSRGYDAVVDLLVIGGSGFLGRTVTRQALLAGHRVTATFHAHVPSADG